MTDQNTGPKLTRKHAIVELADGRILTVRVANPDALRYEQTAQRHGWPTLTVVDGVTNVNDATRRATFEVWAALKRTGQYNGEWQTFQTECLDLAVEEEDVDPTRPAPGSGSSPSSPTTDASRSPSSSQPTTS